MDYKPLKISYYSDRNSFHAEYSNRFNSYSTLKTGLSIHPFDKGYRINVEYNELFYIPLMKHEMLKETIDKNSRTIKGHMRKLPRLVNDKLILSQIIEEIQSTNDIEGVESTRHEIGKAIRNRDSNEIVRFKGIVNMYMNLGEKKFQQIEDFTKIRDIYDALFIHDIPDEDQPDGDFFRKDVVFVGTDSKHVHQGNSSEESIIKDLSLLVTFMNRKDIPFILKCIISHYFFEYIHPFYDGNGRMGRFLMSNYLARKLDPLTGITISNAVIHNKIKYEKAFSEVSNPHNKADLTMFVQSLYEMIILGQNEIIDDLENARAKLKNADDYLSSLNLNLNQLNILFILSQHYLFDVLNEPLKDSFIREKMNFTPYTSNKLYKELVDLGYLIQTGHNPRIHQLTELIKDNIS